VRKRSYPGINIQFPISQLIISGKKTVETRTYPIPSHYVGIEMALIETPGKKGNFTARVIGIVRFGPSFKYKSKKEFYSDFKRHHVTADSPWAWTGNKKKWGWPVEMIKPLNSTIPIKKRTGIKFTKSIEL
jgi:hypothetical protein